MAFWKIYKEENNLQFDKLKDKELTIIEGERNIYNYLITLNDVGSVNTTKSYRYTLWWTYSKSSYKLNGEYIAVQYKPTKKELEILRPKKKYTKLKPRKIELKKGDVFYTSWGYDQTNYDYIVIESISPTGKTAMCRMIGYDYLGVSGQTNVQRPNPTKKYNKPFRMQIRENVYDGKTKYTLVGSYYFSGESDSMRKDSFSKFEKGKKFYETDSQFGH